jgi:hypothetical protein
MMTKNNAVAAAFSAHPQAGSAARQLPHGGFDVKRISMVGAGSPREDHQEACDKAWDRMKCWGESGAFWGGIWGLMFGSAFFSMPVVGALFRAPLVVGWILGALEGAFVVGGLSALGAGIYSLGIPKDSAAHDEPARPAGRVVASVHGSRD